MIAQLKSCCFNIVRTEVSALALRLKILLEVNWFQILDIDVTKGVLACSISPLQAGIERIVSFLTIYHLGCQIDAFVNAVVADHHRHDHQVSATLLNG